MADANPKGDKPPLILHVDDDEANRYAVSRSLRHAGFEVIEAATGREALIKAAARPDLFILDVRLPDISGFEVCRQLRNTPANANTPVLHLSASLTTGEDKARGLDTGADAYLIRPVEPVELIATVNALLRTRRMEDALRESEEKYRLLIGSVGDYAIFTTDAEWKVSSWNLGAEKLFGWREDEVLGRNASLFFTDEDRAEGVPHREFELASHNGSAPDVRWHQRKDGTRFFANGITTAIRATDGTLIGFSKVARDETARRAVEVANASLAAMVGASRDAIFQIDVDGTVRSWNAAAERLFGYAPAEMIGRNMATLTPPHLSGQPQDAIERIRAGEASFEIETQRRNKDGRLIDVHAALSPIRDAAGAIISMAATVRDISERKRTELERQALLEQERRARADAEIARENAEAANRLKDEFLATLSHELRTPLNAIVGWASILRGEQVEEEDYTEGLEAIDRNARAQAQLIEDLLDVSRIISGKLRLDVQRVELASVIDAAISAVSPAAQNKGVRVVKVLDSAANAVWGDPARLQQIVWNLLSNALKFSSKGGRVTVTLSRVNSHVELGVSDTGRGINKEFLPFVFERFRQADATTTRKFGGLGLGLAIVRHLVELHGGTVEAHSEGEGAGAVFTVKLPLTVMNLPSDVELQPLRGASPIKQVKRCPEPELTGVRVLAVDDEPDARNLLRRVLEQCGIKATVAATVTEAVDHFTRERFDVVVSDIGMPDQDGYDLIRQLRALSPEQGGRTPAVALTAFARSEDRRQALMAGFQIHVPKPVDATELLVVIASLAGRMGQASPSPQATPAEGEKGLASPDETAQTTA